MQTKTNYTIVGLFVVIFITTIFVIAFWLSIGLERQTYLTYLAYISESVAGLSKQASVKYNGVDVGFVNDIRLNKKDPQQVILELKIKPNTPITTSTEAVLTEQGITGLAYIGLRAGKETTPLTKKPYEKYPVIKTQPSFMLRLDQALQSLTSNVSGLSVNIKQLLDKENLETFQSTLNNINKITGTIAANSVAIDKSMKSLHIILHNSELASKQFPTLVRSVNESANTLRKMASNGNQAVQTFSSQVMPEVYSTLQNLQSLTQKLESFTDTLQQDPSMLIRGKQAQKPGPGE